MCNSFLLIDGSIYFFLFTVSPVNGALMECGKKKAHRLYLKKKNKEVIDFGQLWREKGK